MQKAGRDFSTIEGTNVKSSELPSFALLRGPFTIVCRPSFAQLRGPLLIMRSHYRVQGSGLGVQV